MTSLPLTGGCQCGAVRYRLDAETNNRNVCHCRMCQKAGGSPFMAFAGLPNERLIWTRGAPKIFASSAIAERGFCEICGTPLTYRLLDQGRTCITLGSLDDASAVKPEIQFGVESRVSWLDAALTAPGQTTSEWLKVSEAELGNRQHPDHET